MIAGPERPVAAAHDHVARATPAMGRHPTLHACPGVRPHDPRGDIPIDHRVGRHEQVAGAVQSQRDRTFVRTPIDAPRSTHRSRRRIQCREPDVVGICKTDAAGDRETTVARRHGGQLDRLLADDDLPLPGAHARAVRGDDPGAAGLGGRDHGGVGTAGRRRDVTDRDVRLDVRQVLEEVDATALGVESRHPGVWPSRRGSGIADDDDVSVQRGQGHRTSVGHPELRPPANGARLEIHADGEGALALAPRGDQPRHRPWAGDGDVEPPRRLAEVELPGRHGRAADVDQHVPVSVDERRGAVGE